jgi:hypothetical protein
MVGMMLKKICSKEVWVRWVKEEKRLLKDREVAF